MIDVHQWAEIRRLHLSEGLGIKAIARRLGLARNTVRAALRSDQAPAYRRPRAPSKLDPFRGEILRLLDEDAEIPGKRVLEILSEQGYRGGKSILNEHLREVRPLFRRARIYQRTTYLPGQLAQWDLWEPPVPIPVGHGHRRRGYVLLGALGYSRVGCGALVFSRSAPDLLWALDRCLARIGAVPRTAVFDREGALCLDKTARDPRPTEPLARYAGALGFGVHFRPAADPEARAWWSGAGRLRGDLVPARPQLPGPGRLPGPARPVVRPRGQRPVPPGERVRRPGARARPGPGPGRAGRNARSRWLRRRLKPSGNGYHESRNAPAWAVARQARSSLAVQSAVGQSSRDPDPRPTLALGPQAHSEAVLPGR